jgi:hypothetical protein
MGFYSIVAFFQKGGLFMYPIMLVFAVGMAITIERWLQPTWRRCSKWGWRVRVRSVGGKTSRSPWKRA